MNAFVQCGLSLIVAIQEGIPIRPTAASSIAEGVDQLHFFLTAHHALFHRSDLRALFFISW